MPLTIPAGDALVSFELRVTGDTQPMFCTIGARPLTGPYGTTQLTDLYNAFRDKIMTSLCSTVQLYAAVARVRQDGGDDLLVEYRPATQTPGSSAATAMPQNVAYIVRKTTARAGRRGRGRMYLPGVPEANVDQAGAVAGATITFINTELSGFLTAVIDTQDLLLFHDNASSSTTSVVGPTRTVTTTQGAAGPSPDVITGLSIDPRVGTQRRRLR